MKLSVKYHPPEIIITENMRKRADREAKKIVKACKEAGMKPRFGGDYRSHYIGKLGEQAFLLFLKNKGIKNVEIPAIRSDYRILDHRPDFIVNGREIEVKTQIKSGKSYFLYPISQFQKYYPDLVVFIDYRVRENKCVLYGYIQGWRIEFMKKDYSVRYPAYRIPESELSKMEKLLLLLGGVA